MDPSIIGVAVSIAVPAVGALIAIGKLFQRVSDHERRITRLENDDDAEDAARLRCKGADA